jgi:hypothetical protein
MPCHHIAKRGTVRVDLFKTKVLIALKKQIRIIKKTYLGHFVCHIIIERQEDSRLLHISGKPI